MFWEGGWECCIRNVILDLFPHAEGGGRVGGGGHVRRGGVCFTMDFCRLPLDFCGFIACGFDVFGDIREGTSRLGSRITAFELTFKADCVTSHGIF